MAVLLVCVLLLAGCSGAAGPEPEAAPTEGVAPPVSPTYTVEELVEALRRAGLTAEFGEAGEAKEVFGAPYQRVLVEGEAITVYRYPDARTAWQTVDVHGFQVYSALVAIMVTPAPGLHYRSLRPGNLVIMMGLTDPALADRIAAAVHAWAGPAPGEVALRRPEGPEAPGNLGVDDVLTALRAAGLEARLSGEQRPGGPGGVAGAVIEGRQAGRYVVYVFPSREAQERAEVPLRPTGQFATGYVRHGNLIVALEPEPGGLSDLELERGLLKLGRFPGAGRVEQAGELTFLRPLGFAPTQSMGGWGVWTWAYDDSFVLSRPYEQAQERLGGPGRFPTLEDVALDRIAGFRGTALAWEPATLAGQPALRTRFRRASGDERVLYTLRRAASFYTLVGPAEVVDGIAYTARSAGQFPYRPEFSRQTFAQAGIEVPEALEFALEGHRLILSVSSGMEFRDWRVGSLEVYGAAEAPPKVQARLLTALTPLRLGRGRPVWRYGCEATGPATGGVIEIGGAFNLCARSEEARFTLYAFRDDQVRAATRTELRLRSESGAGGRVQVAVNQGERVVVSREGALPLTLALPQQEGVYLPWSITITGEGSVVGEAVVINADGGRVGAEAGPSMGAVPYRLEHVAQRLARAGLTVEALGPDAPPVLPGMGGHRFLVGGQEVQVYIFPDPGALQQLTIDAEGRQAKISGATYPLPWPEMPRLIRIRNLLFALPSSDAQLAAQVEKAFE
ncbi:MAG: hypothetical protein ACOY94_13560 [Bacillota bacterium]